MLHSLAQVHQWPEAKYFWVELKTFTKQNETKHTI
jgi:hypothetical protein